MTDQQDRILIVDPDPACVDELTELIQAEGHPIITARTGDDGLKLFWETLPALVFVDIIRVGDSGERMCHEIKRTDHGVLTPIVVHSQHYPWTTRAEVMRNCGAIDYILRPFQPDKIRALLAWALAAKDDSGQRIAHQALDQFSLSSESEGAVSLVGGSLPYLLGRTEEEKLSGLLLMIADGHKSALLMEQGLIVGACSNARAAQLERLLLSMRKLTPAQLRDVKSKVQAGEDSIPLLTFLGILRGYEPREVLRHQALTIGLSMFRESTGRLQFRHGATIDCARLVPGLRPTTLALIGLRKNSALLKTATDRFVRDQVVFKLSDHNRFVGTRSLPLTKFERTVLDSVDGERNIRELRELGSLAQIDLDQPLAILVGSGIIKPSATQSSGMRSKRFHPPSPTANGTPMSGSFEQHSFLEVVGALLQSGATGMLTVEGMASRSFAFLGHELVFAQSNKPEDSLGRLLVGERVITREALVRALAVQQQAPDRRLGSILVEMHELTPDSLATGLQSQIRRILDDTFTWRFGKFEFAPSAHPPDWRVRLDIEPVSLLRRGTYKMSHKQLTARWSHADARLKATTNQTDKSLLTSPERDLLAEACRPGGIELKTIGVGALRRARLLVVTGHAQVVGAADLDKTPEKTLEAVIDRDIDDGKATQKSATTAPPMIEVDDSEEMSFEIVSQDDDGMAAERRQQGFAFANPPRGAVRRPDDHNPRKDTSDSTSAILAFLEKELVAEKRALEARLRSAEADLRQSMEELGRLRERTRYLELENQTLRRSSRPVNPTEAEEGSKGQSAIMSPRSPSGTVLELVRTVPQNESVKVARKSARTTTAKTTATKKKARPKKKTAAATKTEARASSRSAGKADDDEPAASPTETLVTKLRQPGG